MPAAPAKTAPKPPLKEVDLWDDDERRAWRPPEKITLPAWAEKYRVLSRRQSRNHGPWRNATAPATIGYQYLLEMPQIRVLWVLKHSQGGWSEATRNFIAKKAATEPDPGLLVLPDKDKGRDMFNDRLLPLFEDTECLRNLSTGRSADKKQDKIFLSNGFTLRLGYSGSLSSVASHPAKWCFCDERSKFQDDGKVSIADSIEARTSTYEDSKIINLSTPGPDPDPTDAGFRNADVRLLYMVRCPHCDHEQSLTFEALAWEPKSADEPDKNKRASAVIANESAWMKCLNPRCAELHPAGRGRIYDADRKRILQNACWTTECGTWRIYNDGRTVGTWQRGWTIVGLHAPAFTSLAPKHSCVEIAARFIRAEGDLIALIGVYNELFAEVYRASTSIAVTDTFAAKCRPDKATGFVPGKAGVLPKWTARVLMSVDTQKDHFYYVVRAYGFGKRTRRIAHGKAFSFDDLSDIGDKSFWPYEDAALPARRVDKSAIDSGGGKMGLDASRTDEVYRWCLKDPLRRLPIKGESEPRGDLPIRHRKVIYSPPEQGRNPYEVMLWLLNTQHFQDILASDIEAQTSRVNPDTGELLGDEDLWQLNDLDDPEYNRHLSNMKKAQVRSRGKTVERWIPKTTGARVDYRACEVYNLALAHGPGQCMALPTFEQMKQMISPPTLKPSGGLTTPDGRSFFANRR